MLSALVLALLLLPAPAAAAPIYADYQRFLAHARPEAQVKTFKSCHTGYIGDAAVPRLLALDAGSEGNQGPGDLPSGWSDKRVVALVTVLLVFSALNLGGLILLVILFKRQRRDSERLGIQLREVHHQRTLLQAGARPAGVLPPSLPPPSAGGRAAGRRSSTESTVTLVPHLPASRF
ncbi:hypothetical protein B0H17DRAFT_1074052 [Mycena rosella]|uniref:Uncharacterized protein n=1 Tax=Mycena rosella TaxID=1033263 RepID=A0AAD7D7Z6_MYCRO|nr:hypothetical protein B0H17DRAFT_1074052 [Mycena rosella]